MELELQPLSEATFAPYGKVIGIPAARLHPADAADGAAVAAPWPVRAINGGTSQRWDMPGTLQLHAQGGKPCVAVFRAQAQDSHGPWRQLERHRLGTQTFIPLAGARCVVVVARGDTAPDPATLAAFTVRGDQGFTLHADTWHHGLIAVDSGDFVVIERLGHEVDCEFAELARPLTLRS